MKTIILLPLLLVTIATITPASANWFSNPKLGINRHVGSAPGPTPEDIRQMRKPFLHADEDADTKVATAGSNVTAANTPAPIANTQGGGQTPAPASAPSR